MNVDLYLDGYVKRVWRLMTVASGLDDKTPRIRWQYL